MDSYVSTPANHAGDEEPWKDPSREPYTLNQPAAGVYATEEGPREAVCELARQMAELTIPSSFPPKGYRVGDDIPGNNQSLGAFCVSNLSSKLMFLAFPPGHPYFTFHAVDFEVQAQIAQDPELWSETQLALSRLEEAHRLRMDTTPLRSVYVGEMEQQLIAGNVLHKHITLGEPTYHRMDSYIVKRSSTGVPLLTIHKEQIAVQSLDKDIRDWVYENHDTLREKPTWEQVVDFYSVMTLQVSSTGERTWAYWQEDDAGNLVPDSEIETDFDDPPMWPMWLIPVYGQDWGRSYCERYRGDLYTMEALASGANDGASLAALALLFVKPGNTSIKSVRNAKNLSVLPGSAEDLSVFRSDKSADFNFVVSILQMVARRLSQAFLLYSSVQRDGERVTKEEIQRLTSELDQAMGGLYTEQGQSNQRVIIHRFIRLNEEANAKLPPLPASEQGVELKVVTGTDSMGMSDEERNLTEFGATVAKLFPAEAGKILRGLDFARRLAAAKGIKPDGLIPSQAEYDQETQQSRMTQMGMELASKAAGPVSGALAKGMSAGAQPAPTQQ